MLIKCIGCFKLVRVEMLRASNALEVYYDCPGIFPYMTSIGGILRPGKGIEEAAKDCADDPLSHCILCTEDTDIAHYGENITAICHEHNLAWGQWLDGHPERRAYLAHKGRVKRANWVEVFREFIEDMRKDDLRS